MGQGHGERIGCICLQLARDAEQDSDHVLDLALVSATTTDHGLLDLLGRVLGQGKAAIDDSANRRPARLSQLERGIGIARHEYTLDRDFRGGVGLDDRADLVENLFQSQVECFVAEHIDGRMEYVVRTTVFANIDHTDTGALTARINSEDSNHRLAIPADPAIRVTRRDT